MASGSTVLIVCLLVAVGAAAFVLGLLSLLWRGLAWVGGGMLALAGLGRSRDAGRALRGVAPRLRLCPNEKCRGTERRAALYCARCGGKL